MYAEFDRRNGADGYDARRAELLEAVSAVGRSRDLAALPANDLASSPLADELRALGAFRADVSGAGPTVYGLFHHRQAADAARRQLRSAVGSGSRHLPGTVDAWCDESSSTSRAAAAAGFALHRIRLALWIAVLEGARRLRVIPRRLAVRSIIVLALLAFYIFVGRNVISSDTRPPALWIVAASHSCSRSSCCLRCSR